MTDVTARVIGYARAVPCLDDTSGSGELEAAGAQRVYVDGPDAPAPARARAQWTACLEDLRPGDTLLVWRLSHLAGNANAAVELIASLHERGVHLRSLAEPAIDSTTTTTLTDVAEVLANLRASNAREQTRNGLARARTRGRVGGRPSVMDATRTRAARQMRADGTPITAIAATLGVGASSVARALARTEPDPTTPAAPQQATLPAGRDAAVSPDSGLTVASTATR